MKSVQVFLKFEKNLTRMKSLESKMKFKYSLELLQSTIERDRAVLISTHETVQKRTIIQFRCQCGIVKP